ncbi:unnamed protein product [Alopecurus aequalis]
MDEAGNKIYDFGTDVLLDIIGRLPLSSRRRVRLVCRRWRSAVDDRTSDMLSRAVRTLISVRNTRMGTATGYIIDDLRGLTRWSLKKRWTGTGDVHVIGTCNGLICLCDDRKPGGAITLANPVTGEGLTVPPLPGQGQRAPSARWHEAYSFGYHPLTGRYKIVHVPCYLDPVSDPIAGWHDVVHVLTLGEASWRSVPVPAAVRAIGSLGSGGLVSVDGTTYWLAKGAPTGQAVSFDLGDERIYARPLPVTPKPGVTLTVVQERLGVALDRARKTDVWVLHGGKWRHRYEVRLDGWQRLTSPHFAHGKHVLTAREGSSQLYGHMLRAKRSLLVSNVPRIKGAEVRSVDGCIDRTFAYVETTEPLSI